jgi:hypothetical protein
MTPGLWLVIAALVSAACLLWLMLDMRRQPVPDVLAFVVYAIFFRFMLSAFHPFTFPAVVGPLSINALYSVLVIALGIWFIDHRLLRLRFLLPLYGLLALTVLSAAYNHSFMDSVQSLLKWLFFLVIALATYESVVRAGRVLVLEKLVLSFSVPIVLQLLSIALGYSKSTEDAASVSYVGGYNHEAVFSVMLISALMLVMLRQMLQPRVSPVWTAVSLMLTFQIAMANYRTAILSLLTPLFGYLCFHFLYRGSALTRVAATCSVVAAAVLLTTVDFSAVVDRFAEIGTVLDSASQLIKAPIYYTEWEQDYFSARIYIWSQYIDAYMHGDIAQHLIGFGADSWARHFDKYAHNTFISILYELGMLGCFAIVLVFVRPMLLCLGGPLTTYSAQLLLCFAGFVVMNLGTMPLWQIEGMILFAVLSSLAWELKLASSAKRTQPDDMDARIMAGEPV